MNFSRSTKKKAKRNSSIKKKPGISSSKRLFFCYYTLFPLVLLFELNVLRVLTSMFSIFRSKKNPQKSDIECMDIPIPDKMNDAADVGCETSSGKKERVDKEDNDIRQKQGSEAYKVLLERSLLEDHPSDKVLSLILCYLLTYFLIITDIIYLCDTILLDAICTES